MNENLVKASSHIYGFFNNNSVSSFLGAFFAFIFGIIAYIYTKKREKWASHHNALVKTEQLLNRHLNDISGNIFLLKGSLETFSKGAFSENELNPLENPDFMTEFHNLELINTYQDYESLVRKVNHDMLAWNRSNARLFDVALSGRVGKDSIDKNRAELMRRTKEIVNHMKDLMESTYTTGAYIRKFMAVDKRDIFARLSPTENIELTKEELSAERVKYVKESRDTMERDRKERLGKYKSS